MEINLYSLLLEKFSKNNILMFSGQASQYERAKTHIVLYGLHCAARNFQNRNALHKKKKNWRCRLRGITDIAHIAELVSITASFS